MKYLFITFLVCLHTIGLCQQKGASPIEINKTSVVGATYAVVVGISDYQDPAIPDLRFADKDAEAFANFLRSPSGGSLDGDHLKILINQNATAGRVAEAMDWLLEQTKAGDEVIIYFSGHGDVERKTISQPGFLLCWDSPARVYMGGGTYSLAFLQEIVTTLSVQNQAKVFVVTDACHAGKLAGNQIGGSQLTAANLAKQYANEVKILSCQPDEFSLEGEQWGGGRGVFSYYLVDGLLGLADRNGDGTVSLGEIDRYLEDHVTAEAAPQSQVPVLLGNKTERLAVVNTSVLEDLKKAKDSRLPVFAAIESRGFEDEILSMVDSSVRQQFYAFKKAIVEKRFFEPENDCAEKFYAQLSQNKTLEPLQGFMKRNYAAALQDDAQQAINKYMRAEVKEISLSTKTKVDRYGLFPRQLARAAELLGERHYLYRELRARQAYFEGFPSAFGGGYNNTTIAMGMTHFREALSWQPEMPLALLGMCLLYRYNTSQADSAENYARRAAVVAPTWVLPYVRLSEAYSGNWHQYDKALEYLTLAKSIDSTDALVWDVEARYYFEQKKYTEAEPLLKKIIAIQTSTVCLPCTQNMLAEVYLNTGRITDAEALVNNLIETDSTIYTTFINLGRILTQFGRIEEAKRAFKKVAQLASFGTNPDDLYNYWLAWMFAQKGEFDKAFEAFEKSILAGYDDYFWMQEDPDYVLLRARPEWNPLMKKYFPDKFKEK